MKAAPHEITHWLNAWHAGDPTALDRLMELVYGELRQLARRHLANQKPGHALQPSDLVNEAFTHLHDQSRIAWESRAHFFAFAAKVMHNILLDHARRKKNQPKVGLSEADKLNAPEREFDLIALDEALERLEKLDPRMSRIVELRYFSGLTVEEIAVTLGLGTATVKRDWSRARAWLLRELEGSER